MADGGVNGTAVFVTLAGFLLAYSGLKGATISNTLRSFLAGKPPVPSGTPAVGVGGSYDPGLPSGFAPRGGTGGTYNSYFSDVLTGLGLPVTTANLRALAIVSIIEGANTRYNPLNSVVPHGNSTSFNSVGVQDYKSYSNGVEGTIALLRGSPWAGVRAALAQGNSTSAVLFEFAREYATWGSHPNLFGVSYSSADSVLNAQVT